ncbi:MAG: M24 family metallopeptidase [Planctomycetia bacterium]|nr:M24 family metallopeptidase [Planctomycetia bacterium]
MSTVTNQFLPPLSSGEIEITDPDRYEDIDRKQERIAAFLTRRKYDGLLLRRPCNFAWFTSGAECPRDAAHEPAAALFITPEARVVLADNVDSSQLFDRHLAGMGFQLKQRPWHEGRSGLLDDLCRGRSVACDVQQAGATNEAAEIAALRLPLTALECERLRKLGGIAAHAVEATARNIELGQTEAEIAGQLANRLYRHEVQPLSLRAVADGRGRSYRRWKFGDNTLRRWCFISATVSRWGLCAGVTRSVVFGSPPPEMVLAFQQAGMLSATGMFFSQSGWPLSLVWQKVRRIYEKQGVGDEWQLADQADVVGYLASEVPMVPTSEFTLLPRMPLHWHPSVGPAQVGDTMLVGEEGCEMVTRPTDWPMLCVTVKGRPVELSDLLVRESGAPATSVTPPAPAPSNGSAIS